MHYRDISPALPPLPEDLVTSEDSPAYSGQGYSRTEHVRHLRNALEHCEAAVRCLGEAIDLTENDQ
jgi:hypothetical protein